jgi:hypothetical protein
MANAADNLFPSLKTLRCDCGEFHPSALTLRGDGFICGNCLGRERGLRQALCANCNHVEPVHYHHVRGRRVSDETADWCVNCHQKLHKGRAI